MNSPRSSTSCRRLFLFLFLLLTYHTCWQAVYWLAPSQTNIKRFAYLRRKLQVRTSYLSKEILWGHRLTPLDITFHKSNGLCNIDCAKFHSTTPIADMPNCSARAFSAASKVAPNGESASIDHLIHVQSQLPSPVDCDQQMDSQAIRSRRGSSTSLRERPQAIGKVFNVLPVKDGHQSSSDTNVGNENYIAIRI